MSPYEILGLDPHADDAAVRAAWLAAVRRCPPDRDPEGFRRAREAYEVLCDPEKRIEARLFPRPVARSLPELAAFLEARRRHVGRDAWLGALRP